MGSASPARRWHWGGGGVGDRNKRTCRKAACTVGCGAAPTGVWGECVSGAGVQLCVCADTGGCAQGCAITATHPRGLPTPGTPPLPPHSCGAHEGGSQMGAAPPSYPHPHPIPIAIAIPISPNPTPPHPHPIPSYLHPHPIPIPTLSPPHPIPIPSPPRRPPSPTHSGVPQPPLAPPVHLYGCLPPMGSWARCQEGTPNPHPWDSPVCSHKAPMAALPLPPPHRAAMFRLEDNVLEIIALIKKG